jgi:DNA invertase Pin-like site-specific DNA recombinase
MPLRDYAKARGFDQVEEYSDVGWSGSKERRPQLDRLMTDVRKRRIQTVVVSRFDRFARSTRHLLAALAEFDSLDVRFVSLNESIDTSTPMGKMVFTILGAVAELERSLITERVQSGVDRARRQGKRLGRPKVIVDREKLRELVSQGLSIRAIGKLCGIARSTVNRVLSYVEKPSPDTHLTD